MRKASRHFCLILKKFAVERFEKKWPKENFTEIRPVEGALTHGDGQTDMTKLIGPFRDYAKLFKKTELG